jgi:hypothetical protein
MKLFPFFSALLFAAIAESGWCCDGPTKSQREQAAPTGKRSNGHGFEWKGNQRL